MSRKEIYVVQPYQRRAGRLQPTDPVGCRNEDDAGRRGLAMQSRVAGMVFYRIETSADGDDWTEVEVLATVGDVPQEEAA